MGEPTGALNGDDSGHDGRGGPPTTAVAAATAADTTLSAPVPEIVDNPAVV